jgi:hypothetical protein
MADKACPVVGSTTQVGLTQALGRSMKYLASLTVLLTALCMGCASTSNGADTYSGEYFYNFEFAYLTPTGKSEQWCINGDMSKAELSERWGTSHVTVQGTL